MGLNTPQIFATATSFRKASTIFDSLQIQCVFYTAGMLNQLCPLFIIYAIIAMLWMPSRAIPANSPVSVFASASIDISSLTAFLSTLRPDEQEEQLRDWACMDSGATLVSRRMRRFLSADRCLLMQEYEVSPGRVFQLSKQEWGFWFPENFSKTGR